MQLEALGRRWRSFWVALEQYARFSTFGPYLLMGLPHARHAEESPLQWPEIRWPDDEETNDVPVIA